MSEKDWEQFGELLQKIVAMEGTWQEKKEILNIKAKEFAFEVKLDEVICWYGDEW